MNYYGKRILKSAVFFAGLLLLLLLASHICKPKDNTRQAGMEEFFANGILSEKENTIDALIAGDSFSYTYMVPNELWKSNGFTSYEIGTNDQNLDYTMVMLRRSFQNQTPKLVVLEPSLIFHDVSRLKQLIEILEPTLPVFHDHDRWKDLNAEDFDLFRNPEYTQHMDYKGYQYLTRVEPAGDSKPHNMVPSDEAEDIPYSSRKYIQQIKDYCDRNNARLVFVSAPNALTWNYAQHNAIEALADELGCEYMDMNLYSDEIGIDWTHDTADQGDHLNHAGAVKATRFLADYLDSLGILEDHRGDPEYEDWDECQKVYERKVAKEDI